MAGRPPKEKSFANMLNIAISVANESGGTKLREVADALVQKAIDGDVQAIREIADRLDGKVPQAVVGDDSEAPVRVALIERIIVDPVRYLSDRTDRGLPDDGELAEFSATDTDR